MTYLDKKTAIFQRNEAGELIPEEVVLELLDDKPIIQAIPMTRGKIKELGTHLSKKGETTKDQDSDIIENYCINPKFTQDDIKFMKPNISSAIVIAILAISLGMTQDELSKKTTEKAISMQEEQIKK